MRLIDADALEPSEMIQPLGNGQYEYVRIVYMDDIDAMTAIETEQSEIIRCRDCKFYTSIQKHSTNLKIGICSLSSRYIGDDGFCSETERREDG